jgi:hypothetical protein
MTNKNIKILGEEVTKTEKSSHQTTSPKLYRHPVKGFYEKFLGGAIGVALRRERKRN